MHTPSRSRFVMHCTNAYASHLLPSLASGLNSIVPTRGQLAAIQPTQTNNPHWKNGFGGPATYFFQRPNGGEVLLGGFRELNQPREEFGESDDSTISAATSRGLRGYLVEQFPAWFEVKEGGEAGEVMIEWTGVMAYRR